METLITAGQFLLSLSILIILHECGHFFPARWFNTRVEKFYLFFDPWFELIKFKKGDTEYGIGWLPLGGYVKISGMIDESFDKEQMAQPVQPWEFRAKKAWQRLVIMLGGVTVNFVLAVLVFAGIFLYWGEKYLSNDQLIHGVVAERLGQEIGILSGDQIKSIGGVAFDEFDPQEATRRIVIDEARSIEVLREGRSKILTVPEEVVQELTKFENKSEVLFSLRVPVVVDSISPASEALKIGLKQGDYFLSIDSEPAYYYEQYAAQANSAKNQISQISILRNRDTIAMSASFDSLGRLGFFRYLPNHFYEVSDREFNTGQALYKGWDSSIGFIGDQIKAFGQMFKGKIKASESLGSFISIGKMYGPKWDWRRFWAMTATLSALLGFVNLLPIPGLDGGHVMFLLWEVVTGKKPSDTVLEISTMIGFFLLIGLMIYALGIDIMRHF